LAIESNEVEELIERVVILKMKNKDVIQHERKSILDISNLELKKSSSSNK